MRERHIHIYIYTHTNQRAYICLPLPNVLSIYVHPAQFCPTAVASPSYIWWCSFSSRVACQLSRRSGTLGVLGGHCGLISAPG